MTDYKNLKLIASSSPHIRSNESTRTIMMDVIIAMIPALIMSVFVFGFRALALTLVSVAACVFWEWGYRKLLKKPQSIGDLSAPAHRMAPSGPVIRRENRRRRRPPSSSPRASRCPSPWTQARHRPGSGGWQITSNRWSSPAAVTVMVPAARSPIYTGYVMQRASPSKHPRQGLCQCMHSLRRGCPVPPYPAESRLSTTRSHPRLSVS